MISSTRSSESAFKSSMNEASGTTSSSVTLSWSAMIFLSRSSAVCAIPLTLLWDLATYHAQSVATGSTRSAPVRGDQTPQDAVDEPRRAFTAVQLGKLDCLVDRDLQRNHTMLVAAFV